MKFAHILHIEKAFSVRYDPEKKSRPEPSFVNENWPEPAPLQTSRHGILKSTWTFNTHFRFLLFYHNGYFFSFPLTKNESLSQNLSLSMSCRSFWQPLFLLTIFKVCVIIKSYFSADPISHISSYLLYV